MRVSRERGRAGSGRAWQRRVRTDEQIEPRDPQHIETAGKRLRVGTRVDEGRGALGSHQHRVALSDIAGRDRPLCGQCRAVDDVSDEPISHTDPEVVDPVVVQTQQVVP